MPCNHKGDSRRIYQLKLVIHARKLIPQGTLSQTHFMSLIHLVSMQVSARVGFAPLSNKTIQQQALQKTFHIAPHPRCRAPSPACGRGELLRGSPCLCGEKGFGLDSIYSYFQLKINKLSRSM